jgi:hypothetical protein
MDFYHRHLATWWILTTSNLETEGFLLRAFGNMMDFYYGLWDSGVKTGIPEVSYGIPVFNDYIS